MSLSAWCCSANRMRPRSVQKQSFTLWSKNVEVPAPAKAVGWAALWKSCQWGGAGGLGGGMELQIAELGTASLHAALHHQFELSVMHSTSVHGPAELRCWHCHFPLGTLDWNIECQAFAGDVLWVSEAALRIPTTQREKERIDLISFKDCFDVGHF